MSSIILKYIKVALQGCGSMSRGAFICISLMSRDGEPLLRHLVAVALSSLGRCLFKSLTQFPSSQRAQLP